MKYKRFLKRYPILAGMILLVLTLPGQAAGHGIGLDVVKLVDQNQDGGMFNVHGQIALTGDTAVSLGYAGGDDLTILDAGIKHYFGRYMDSLFLHFGIGYHDHDRHGSDLGFIAALGYERKLATYLAVSGSVKMVAGVDEEVIGYPETPVFQPTLSIMIAF